MYKKIKQQRMFLMMTQKELSERTGVSQTHISQIESGKHNANLQTIEKLCEALNLSISIESNTDEIVRNIIDNSIDKDSNS
jgi:transcriptional regulator with XRE-family HTH domain